MSADIADLSHAAQSAIVEVRQYVPDAHIGRHEDPLAWRGEAERVPEPSADGKTTSQHDCDISAERMCVLEKQTAYFCTTYPADGKKCGNGYVSEWNFW